MLRLLLALPCALIICYSLLAVMAWMVDLNAKPLAEHSDALSFDIFMAEKEQSSQRKNRVLPDPPQLKQEPVSPQQMQPQMQSAMTSPELQSVPDIKMDLSVSAVAVAVPVIKSPGPAKALSQPASSAVKVAQNQQMMPLYRMEPVYPRKALRRKIQGYVVLSFDIDKQGRPKNIQVIKASPARIFNKEAIKALRNWKYQPQVIDGQAQDIVGQKIKLEFKLS